MTTKARGKAFASRTDGNVYQVAYEHGRSYDRDVPYRYLKGLVESGYEVVIAAGPFGPRKVGTLLNGEVVWARA